MTELIYGYLRPLLAVTFLAAVLRAVFPEKLGGKLISYACGLLVLTVAAGPIFRPDPQMISEALAEFRLQNTANAVHPQIDTELVMAEIIKEKTEAYISDKADELHATLHSVQVTVKKGGEYPYPAAVAISGYYTPQQRTEIAEWIEINLAIPMRAQTWELK